MVKDDFSPSGADLPQGTCYGFEIRSSLGFRSLRVGTGDPLVVSPDPGLQSGAEGRLLLDWSPGPAQPLRLRLFELGEQRFQIWIHDGGWFEVDTAASHITLGDRSLDLVREERLLGFPLLLCFSARGDLPLHASAVEVENRAILFAAPGGFGKTTLAATFAEEGYRVLSEDLCCIRQADRPALFPGPALLRVRRDMAKGLGLPAAGRAGEDRDRIHYVLKDPGHGGAVPIAGLVLLREGDLRLEAVDPLQAIPDLMTLSFRLPSEEAQVRCFEGVVSLADRLPIWNLYRPLEAGSLPATRELILSEVRG